MRKIESIDLEGIEPNNITSLKPRVIIVSPGSLRVDETYQRNLSNRSHALIRKIITEWDWLAFKPPIVAATDDEGIYDVVDGQHTAIAAVSHPGVGAIPALLIQPEDLAGRAMSFVKHNRDRISVTKVDEFIALIAAGDERAMDVKNTCDRHGVTILRNKPGKWDVGDTMSISVISSLVKRRFPAGAGHVFSVCVRAQLAPLAAEYIRAVERLIFAPEYKGGITDDQIVAALRPSEHDETMRQARKFAAEHRDSLFRSMASVIYRDRTKRRA